MATIDEIKQQAAAVKNATQIGENTAERVGGALAGLAEIAEQQDSKLSDLAYRNSNYDNGFRFSNALIFGNPQNILRENGEAYYKSGFDKKL